MGNFLSSKAKESLLKKAEDLKASGGAVWEWQSNKDPWATDELPQWTKYSIEQMQIIEKAFQEKKETVEIGKDYMINFESGLQMHKEQSWKVRPVRRTEMEKRAMRFCSELTTPRTFGRVTFSGDPTIVEKWLNKRKFNFKIDKYGYNVTDEKDMPQLREVVALAIKGILEEGEKDNWSDFAKVLTKGLEDSLSHNPKNIFRECIYIYTDENKAGAPSLYTIANRALREIDYSKIETLGPYCYLLNFALKALSNEDAEFFYAEKVYRGLGLDQNMFEMYKTAWKRGLQSSFHSFVSTSKSEEMATLFSLLDIKENQRRVLLVIENLGGAYIEALTSHHGEDEVLLPASKGFQITNIDEKNSDLTIISLKMVNTKLDCLFVEEFPHWVLSSNSSFTDLPENLSQWAKGIKVSFEISEDGTNITPENKSSELKEFVKLAAEGIFKLGETQSQGNQREKGRKMAEMLIDTMKKRPEDIFKVVLKLMDMDSFLTAEVWKCLSSEKLEELKHLGPYCYLLISYLMTMKKTLAASSKSKKNSSKFVTLYRFANSSPLQINLFKELYEKGLHYPDYFYVNNPR